MLWMAGREAEANSLETLRSLVRDARATRILEVGTGDGEVTLALIAELPPDAPLITMEADATIAAAARQRFAAAGFAHRISVIVGEPVRFLHKIRGPFDVIVRRVPDEPGALGAKLAVLLRPEGVLIGASRNIVRNHDDR